MFTFALLIVLAMHSTTVDEEMPPEKPVFEAPSQKKMLEQPVADPFTADAQLNDVCFVDLRNGWAVGDRGAIWHTTNGGQTWDRQPSGVRCTLNSVCFLDAKTGYAAGGFSQPYSHQGLGVLLSTRDGGQTWSRNLRLVMPIFKRIGFFDALRGWAVSTPSAMYPSGAFTTDDRGKSWKSLLGPGSAGWLTGDFIDSRTAALAGRNGTLGEVKSGVMEPPQESLFGLKNLRQVRLVRPDRGWLVGDAGTVAATDDQGRSWHPPLGALPEGTTQLFDFAALAVRREKIWIAGTPGTVVFHSADAGRTWSVFPTGSPLPVRAIAFADDDHGWAVGALGTILATQDGGRTWQRQRDGGSRAAVLGLFAEADDIPLELFAKLSAQDGNLGVVEALTRRDVEVPPREEVPLADRVHQAAVEVGASDGDIAWNFALRQKGIQLSARQFVEGWDRMNDGRGLQEFQAHLVCQIRIWRPELLVTQEVGSRTNDPLSQLVGRFVLQAVEEAADPTKYPEQINRAGLSPWQVKKVFAVSTGGSHGPADLTTSQLASRLGASLADAAADPRGLIADRYLASPPQIGFRSLSVQSSGEKKISDSTVGMGIQGGKESRRELLAPPAENLDALHRAAMQRRNAQAIIELSTRDSMSTSQLLAKTDSLIFGLDESSAGRILFQMGDTYCRAGRWSMAAETYRALVGRYPNHPLTRSAIIWLMRYYTSGEAAWRERREQGVGRQPSPATNVTIQGAAAVAGQDSHNSDDRFSRAISLGKEVERTRPDLLANPWFRFPLASAERRKATSRQVGPFYLAQSRSPMRDAWSRCALGEIWLAERKENNTKAVMPCLLAAKKPKLDGVLDDEVWKKAKPVLLVSAQHDDEDWPACAALAYDAEFLYVAISCKKPAGEGRGERGEGREQERAGASSPPATVTSKEIRTRDADLSAHDRVDILLDIDRDYATYYRFTVDHRGWTAESCWGDSSWNPDWYVAATNTEDTWTVEIAIPRDQLVEESPKSRDAWALGIQRTVPGVGFQSWTTPASTDILPEGFGYLIFD